MRFKHRIWLLPIMTAVIVSAGIAVNSRITSRASAALERVQQVQYPTVEAMRSLRAEVTKIQETLQQAVAEGDHTALNAAAEHAISVRSTLKELAKLEGPDGKLSSKLSEQFESYYAAATTATGILLGTDKGDSAKAVADMQATAQSLSSLLDSSNDTALADFRGLLSGSADDVRETLKVSVIAAAIMLAILGAGSWILIGSVFASLGVEPEAAVDIVRRIADGDFTAKVDVRFGDNSSLLHGLGTLKSKLGDLIRDVHSSSAAVDAAAGDMNTAVNELSERTSGQAASLEETAASMEQMTATIKQNADNTRHATEVAMAAQKQAEVGGEVVNRAVSAMSQINSSSKKIADIIGVIDEIAFQTNLLALNAAVEAARAGEQGRGFAVVASEVRNLAQRSSSAAREIKNLIQDSVVKVQDGQKLVNESGQHLTDIVTSVKKVAGIITEMASASQEQSLGLDQVNKAIMQMDQMTQQNSAMVDQTSAVAQTMSNQAKQLTAIVGVFRIDSDHATSASVGPAHHAAREEHSSVADHHAWQEVA